MIPKLWCLLWGHVRERTINSGKTKRMFLPNMLGTGGEWEDVVIWKTIKCKKCSRCGARLGGKG